MQGGELIREARKRAGLSQQQLAELLLTAQPVIARWESGKTSPSFRRVVEAIRACGFDLDARVVTADDQHALLIEDNLERTPAERLQYVVQGQSAISSLVEKVRSQNAGL